MGLLPLEPGGRSLGLARWPTSAQVKDEAHSVKPSGLSGVDSCFLLFYNLCKSHLRSGWVCVLCTGVWVCNLCAGQLELVLGEPS